MHLGASVAPLVHMAEARVVAACAGRKLDARVLLCLLRKALDGDIDDSGLRAGRAVR